MTQDHASSNLLEIDNLPNRITLFRIILIPIIFLCLLMQLPSWPWPLAAKTKVLLGWIAGWTFVVAAVTDFVDGYIARKRKIVTIFGSFLDPIADKFLVISALIMLLAIGRVHVVIVTILVLREIYIMSLRLLASSEGLIVPVNKLAKWKTATQMIGMPMLMANAPLFGIPLPILGPLFIYLASFLSLYSATIYSLGLVKKIKEEHHRKKMEKEELKAKEKNREN